MDRQYVGIDFHRRRYGRRAHECDGLARALAGTAWFRP